jgi:intein/homing endonuclease
MILSYNTELKQLEWDMLDNAALTREKASIIELVLDSGETLKLTPDHKVFTENRGWVEAAQLTEEDILLTIK